MVKDYLSQKDQDLLDEWKKDNTYSGDYVEFKRGPGGAMKTSKTKCMRCGKVIIDWEDTPTQILLRKGEEPPTYIKIRKNLNKGSYLNVLVCPDCKDKVRPEDHPRVMAVIRAGLVKEMEINNRPKDIISRQVENLNELSVEETI